LLSDLPFHLKQIRKYAPMAEVKQWGMRYGKMSNWKRRGTKSWWCRKEKKGKYKEGNQINPPMVLIHG
jgi:hypothetical protein